MRPSILFILSLSSYAAALAILDSAPVGRDVAGALEAKSLAVVDDFETRDSDDAKAVGSFFSLMHALDDLDAVKENPDDTASEDTSDDVPSNESTETTDDLEDIPAADIIETADSNTAGVADAEDIAEDTASDSSPVIDNDYSLEDSADASPADVDDSNIASDDDSDRALYNPEATKTLAFSGVDSFTLPLKLLNGTIAEGCTTLCEAVITPVSACITTAADATDAEQAECLCTDTTIGSLGQCLDCVINAVDLGNDTLSSLQQGVDDIGAQCSEAGFPVSPISLTNGTQPSNSTDIPSNTTTASTGTTSTGTSTSTPAPTGTTPVTNPTSGAISQVKVGAGMTIALLGALVGTFF